MTDLGETLGHVAAIRAAARAILRDDSLEQPSREEALRRLLGLAKRGPAPQLAAGAIVAEIGWSIDRPDLVAAESFGDALERRHRLLRAEGRETCPTCASPISTPTDWDRWRQIRRAAIAEQIVREGAA